MTMKPILALITLCVGLQAAAVPKPDSVDSRRNLAYEADRIDYIVPGIKSGERPASLVQILDLIFDLLRKSNEAGVTKSNSGPSVNSPKRVQSRSETFKVLDEGALVTCGLTGDANGSNIVILPKERTVYTGQDGKRAIMDTFGVMDNATVVVHSVLTSDIKDLDFVLPLLEQLSAIEARRGRQQAIDRDDLRDTNSSSTLIDSVQEHDPATNSVDEPEGPSYGDIAIATLSDALAEYALRSLHSLMSRIVYGLNDGLPVSALLQCQMDSLGCLIDSAFDAEGLKRCADQLCACMSQGLEPGKLVEPKLIGKKTIVN